MTKPAMDDLGSLLDPLIEESAATKPPAGWIVQRARRRRRRRALAGIGLAIVAVALALPISWALRGDDPTDLRTVDVPDRPSPPAAGADDRIVVGDRGVRLNPPGPPSGTPKVSYGVILSNPRDQAARLVRVTVRVLDRNGTQVARDHVTVNLVPAGSEFGIGGELEPDGSADLSGASQSHLELDIDVAEPQAWDPSEHTPVEVDDIVSTVAGGGHVHTTFVVRNAGRGDADVATAWAIYRSPSGEIVGGSTGEVQFDGNGRGRGEINSLTAPYQSDVTRTAVYVPQGLP